MANEGANATDVRAIASAVSPALSARHSISEVIVKQAKLIGADVCRRAQFNRHVCLSKTGKRETRQQFNEGAGRRAGHV